MKKYIGLVVLGLLCATSALAQTTLEKCNSNNGGTLITVGGNTFCKSDGKMNWWSAYSWCQAMGGHLSTIKELCPDAASIANNGGCQRNYGVHVWSSTPEPSSGKMWYLINGNNIQNNGARNESFGYGYCLPNSSSN